MKQTAVEWLIEKIEFLIKNGYTFNPKFEEDLINQAKAMEKEQIMNAWIATDNELQRIAAEQYYNETFKKK